jgi:quercetin dioxygenase-like cupin family protein
MHNKLAVVTTVLLGVLALNVGLAQNIVKPEVTEEPIYVALDSQDWQPCEGLPGCEFVGLFGDPVVEGSQTIFRLEAGTEFPKHWHTSSENFMGVQGELNFNFETGETATLARGDFLHYQGGMVHWGQCAEGEDCVYYVYNDLPYDIVLVEE